MRWRRRSRAGRKLIFSGVGKSAHIAQKLAATFNSTGVSSCFLDSTQALHGDLGLSDEGDLALLLSNSGQSDEILRLLPLLRRFGLKIVAFTGDPASDLARSSDFRLIYRVPREACPLKLAPTASTTAALALGDALAMVLLQARGLTRDDFARYHPAGSLGRALLLRVRDIMRTGPRLAVAPDSILAQDAMLAMTRAKCGCIALIDGRSGRLTGILTDGDFRRRALADSDFMRRPAADFMSRKPKTVSGRCPCRRRPAFIRRAQDRRPDRRGWEREAGRNRGRPGFAEIQDRLIRVTIAEDLPMLEGGRRPPGGLPVRHADRISGAAQPSERTRSTAARGVFAH